MLQNELSCLFHFALRITSALLVTLDSSEASQLLLQFCPFLVESGVFLGKCHCFRYGIRFHGNMNSVRGVVLVSSFRTLCCRLLCDSMITFSRLALNMRISIFSIHFLTIHLRRVGWCGDLAKHR